ncbi:MAG: hypothetical protein M2R45_04417 [Verrucomicrobia subdivision 3 bacterium]|nr:hypothetical protein [Limisphaerales bacterium]MCS1413505.1 hypothetical protein [Limisphaerales bacterium]
MAAISIGAKFGLIPEWVSRFCIRVELPRLSSALLLRDRDLGFAVVVGDPFGFLYLAVLLTIIISAVFFTAVVNENIGGSVVNTSVSIFFIMYRIFCDGGINVLAAGLLALGSGLGWWSSRWLGFDEPPWIAAFFCGSQKNLATGVPMVSSIFQ